MRFLVHDAVLLEEGEEVRGQGDKGVQGWGKNEADYQTHIYMYIKRQPYQVITHIENANIAT